MLTFEAFKATGRDVADLQAVPEVAPLIGHDDHKPGRVYVDGGLWIEHEPNGDWYVQIERNEYLSTKLETVEQCLYDFYRAEYCSSDKSDGELAEYEDADSDAQELGSLSDTQGDLLSMFRREF